MSDTVLKYRKISIDELPVDIPDFESSYEPKESLIKKWIINWILSSISKNKIKENDILPNKSDISSHLGVSIGTVQNAIRYIEDEGFLKSKQKLGTMISNVSNPINGIKKSTSKRDKAISAIKNNILQNNYRIGKTIPSTRKMSANIGISQNTTRLAYEYLCSIGVLESRQTRGNDSNWFLKSIPFLSDDEKKYTDNMNSITLVDKITNELKLYLNNNYSVGDKIPSHEELASKLHVSVKTIHDCISNLKKDGIILSRRGRYGCVLCRNPLNPNTQQLPETSIFATAREAMFYSYQKIENKLIVLINNNYKPGEKIPSMQELAKLFDVSTNTIRKALVNLSEAGYLTFGRGRYGGTFVIEQPENIEKQPYQWLSINPEYI